jgi:hypothetical protein
MALFSNAHVPHTYDIPGFSGGCRQRRRDDSDTLIVYSLYSRVADDDDDYDDLGVHLSVLD